MGEKLSIFTILAASVGLLAQKLGLWNAQASTGPTTTPQNFIYTPSSNWVSNDDDAEAYARNLLVQREGRRNIVYRDSEGHLTVGIGHRVTAADNLSEGDYISESRIIQLFDRDFERAFTAAKNQASQIGKRNDLDMLVALTSVNFQLGTAWTNEFYSTWPALQKGDYKLAINNLRESLWAKQTPVRVNDFINAIQRSYA